jgi:L-threonylcarbamoyladenylate synthase
MFEPKVIDLKDWVTIANLLKQGKVVIMETDTVMGIFAKDVKKIYKLKKRDESKKVVLMTPYNINTTNIYAKKAMKLFWPGALTIIVDGISYRMPYHKTLLKILNESGPVYCSSANKSGRPVCHDHTEAVYSFKRHYDEITFVRGKENNKYPSTILDCDNKKVIRQGTIIIGDDFFE